LVKFILETNPRLKTQVWVQGFVRCLTTKNFVSFILKSGDKSSGAVFIKINRLDKGCIVYSQVTNLDGGFHWLSGLGDKWELETKVDEYIERQIKYDRDLWVIEVEDPHCTFEIDGSVLDF
tara:strand:+ start:35 stop:397 length:363 start_codon:yes stop_codon:yes gene_type:complete